MKSILKGMPVKTFDLHAASTGLGTAFALPSTAVALQWQTFFDSAPGAISIELQFSLDNVNWDAVDVSSAVAGEIRTFACTGAKFVRGNIASITAGGATQVSMIILCQQQ